MGAALATGSSLGVGSALDGGALDVESLLALVGALLATDEPFDAVALLADTDCVAVAGALDALGGADGVVAASAP